MKEFKLNNDVVIPSVGIGTFLLSPSEAYQSVYNALEMGYRLIDTAGVYVNERAVGRAIKQSGLNRKDIFVSTKIWPSEYENENAVEETLERLGLDYVDLLFIHQPTKNWRNGYKQLIKAYKEGKARTIGISNFENEIVDVLNEFEIKPQVIQVETHPFFPQEKLRKITDLENIRIMSWFPLGGKGDTDKLLKNPLIEEIANKHHKSTAQVLLKWHVQMGFIVIPGSRNVDHIRENFEIFDFALDEEDMNKIASLNNGVRRHIQTDEKLDAYQAFQPIYEKEII